VTETFDVLIIGAGQAGIPLAADLAKAGRRVALAERKHLGGSCVNFGCTPTKAVIASARVAHLARRAAEFGVVVPSVDIDLPAVLRGARAIVQESRDGLEETFQGDGAPRLFRGHARLLGRADAGGFRVQIQDETVLAREVVLDTGTRAAIPSIPGLDTVPFRTADNWLDHDDLPESLVLLGGGYIGLEMAQFYRRMGSRVTVVDRGNRVAVREDDDVCQALQPILEAEGIVFRLGTTADRVAAAGDGVAITVRDHDGPAENLRGSHLFVAVGRRPNTDDLGLESIGLSLNADGMVPVDEHLRTGVPGIWAVGDIRGGPMFTHTSWDDYRVVMSAMTGNGSHTTDRIVPYGIFTDPQVGRVGATEEEARASGKPVRVGRYDMKHNGRAREYREKAGFVKVIIDSETDLVLGACVVGDEGAELVHAFVTLMNARAPASRIRDSVFVHPTLMEAVQSAVEAAYEV
jgi:pyruvate/2-oxoglutarate dehydrogenase complex dihydrolipoamide dehydrogenase (E3) component